MSIFDTPFSFSDPNQMALLGAIAGLGQAAAPSRLPVTGGMVLGDAAGGLMGGAQQAYKNQAAQQQLLGQGIQNYQNLYMAQTLAKALGMPTPTANQLRAGKYDDLLKSMPNPAGADMNTQPVAAPDASQAPVTAAPLLAPDQAGGTASPAGAGGSPLAALQKSIWQIESGGKLQNVPDSSAGAIGPMQVMPDTGKLYGVGSDALRDPATNIAVGNKYIADLFAKYNGDPQATAVAYNAGTAVADKWLASNRDPRVLPDETQNYLGKLGQLLPNQSRGAALIAPLTAASPPGDNSGAAAAGPAAPAAPSAAASGPSSFAPKNFAQIYQQMMLRRFMGLPITPVEQALYASQMAPPGSQDQRLNQVAAIKAAGIAPFIGGERRGSPIFAYNPATGQYNLEVQNPQLPEGAVEGPGGQISMAPGATQAIAQQAGAEAGGRKGGELPYVGPAAYAGAAGKVQGELPYEQALAQARSAGEAPYEPETYRGPFGQEFLGTRASLPNMGNGATAASPAAAAGQPAGPAGAPPVPPQAVAAALHGAAQSLLAPTQNMSNAAVATPRPEAAAPTFPVQTPGGPKDLNALTVGDMFPGGQGIPRPPAPPAGMGYGKPSETTEEMQKDDAERVEGYAKEATENQKIYQDLAHLRDVLQTGMTTGRLAPLSADLANMAQSLGVPWAKDAATNPAVFSKASTDLVFAAVKKLAGAVKVAEIEGYKQANPNLTLPPQANMSIINDVLSQGKWQDARARLASEYVTQTGGAPLAAFDARYNQMVPLVSLTDHTRQLLQAAGAKPPGFPSFEAGNPVPGRAAPVQQAAPTETRTLGGVQYMKINGQWFRAQ